MPCNLSESYVFDQALHDHFPGNASEFVIILHKCADGQAAPGKFHADSETKSGEELITDAGHWRHPILIEWGWGCARQKPDFGREFLDF